MTDVITSDGGTTQRYFESQATVSSVSYIWWADVPLCGTAASGTSSTGAFDLVFFNIYIYHLIKLQIYYRTHRSLHPLFLIVSSLARQYQSRGLLWILDSRHI